MSFIDDSIKRLREEEKERRKREQAAQLIRGPQSSSNSNSTNSSTSSQNSSQTSQGGSQSPSAVDKLFHSTARKYTNATANDNVTKNNRNVRSAYTNSSAREKANSKKSENEPSRVSDIGKWLGNEFMAGIASGNEAVGKSIIGNAENINKTTKVPFLDRLAGNLLPNGSWNVMKLAGELGSSKLAHDVDDYFSKENEKRQQNVAELRGDSGLREKVGNLTQVMSEQLPMLAYSLLSGGSGGAASGVSAYGKQVATSLVNPASLSTYGNYITRAVAQAGQNMSENPYFWDTFLKTFGPAYYKEKDEGANDAQALVSAATNSFAQSAIEIGGGFETAELKEGFLNKLKEVIKSSGEEGSEEIWQDIVDNLTHKALGSNKSYDEYNNLVTTPWFSTVRGKDAVINPANMIEQGAYGAVAGGLMTGTSFAGRETMNAIANSNYRNANPDIEQRANELIQRASLQGREGEMATRAQNLAEEVSDQMARGKAPTAYQMRELESAVATDEYYNQKAYESSSQERYNQAVEEGKADTVKQTGTADEYYGFRRGLNETEQRNYDKAKAVMGENASENSVVAVSKLMTGSESNRDIDTILLDPEARSAVEELAEVTLPINNVKARAELENIALVNQIANRDKILEQTHKDIRTNMSRRGGEFFDKNYDEAVATIDEPNAADIYESFFSRFYTAGTVEGADFEKTYNRIISPLVEDFGEELGTKISQVFNHDFAQKVFAEGQIAMNSVRAKAQGKRLSVKASENPAGFTYEAEARKHISDKEAELFTKLAERAKVHIRLVSSIAGGKANGSYDPETGVILIAADSDNKFITVFKHELTHHLKNTSPEMYQKLEDFVFKRWYDGDPEKMEERVQEYQRRYGMKPDEAREEIIADASEAFFTDQGAINDAVTFNEKMARAIHDGIKSLLDTFLDLVDTDRRADKGYGDFLEDLDILRDAEKMWLEALNESVGKQKGSVGNKADLDAFLKENGLRELPQTKKMSLKATEDSEGKRLTEGQKKFFKDSRATDKDGKLAVVYHTTDKGGFTVFDPKYSDDKRSLFFASNFDVSQTYSYEGQRGAAVPVFTDHDIPTYLSAVDKLVDYFSENYLANNIEVYKFGTTEKADDLGRRPLNRFRKLMRGLDSGEIKQGEYVVYAPFGGLKYANGGNAYFSPKELLDTVRKLPQNNKQSGYYACYLNFTNPLVVDGKGHSWHSIPYGETGRNIRDDADDTVQTISTNWIYKDESGVPTGLHIVITGEYKDPDGEWQTYEREETFRLTEGKSYYQDDATDELSNKMFDFWTDELGYDSDPLYDLVNSYVDSNGEMDVDLDDMPLYFADGVELMEDDYEDRNYNTRGLAFIAEQDGYDGVIIRNIRDLGGVSNLRSGASEYSDIYIAFNSNQVKLTSNEDPTEDPDIRYSLKDSDGNTLSKGQQEYFKDSKLRDENGNLYVMYHGTQNEFNVFDFSQGGKNGTAEGYGIYLSNSREVTDSYGDRQIKSYVNMKRPASALESQTLTKSELRKLINAAVELDANKMLDDYDGDIESAKKDSWISNYVNTYQMPMSKAVDEVIETITDLNGNDMDIVQEIMNGMGIRDFEDAAEFYDILAETTGIDGFVTKWGDESEMADPKTPVIAVAFRSNQIKNVDNTNPTNDPDIRYSIKEKNEIENLGGAVTEGGTVTKYSLKSWNETDKKKLLQNLTEAGFTDKEAKKWIKQVNSVAAIIYGDMARLDYEADEYQDALKPNSEYFYTLDLSTLCAKRRLYQGTYNAIMKRMPDRAMMPEDTIRLRRMMADMRHEVPCGICYEESRKKNEGKFADVWLNGQSDKDWNQKLKEYNKKLEKYRKKLDQYNALENKGKKKPPKAPERPERWLGYANMEHEDPYIPTLADVTTTTGRKALRENHPEALEAYLEYQKGRGSANPKVSFTHTDYRGDIMRMTATDIENVKHIGGLRIQSFSDFETVHVIDMMQAVMDMASRKLTSQAYTKVPAFADIFGGTGIKINLSLIGMVKNGKLVFDSVEGIDPKEAFRLRKKYSKNVGTIIVGANAESILAAWKDPRIDMVIPFHRSGWSTEEFEQLGLGDYKDFQEYQTERYLDGSSPNGISLADAKMQEIYSEDYWDYNKTGKENAEAYLELCAKKHYRPVFYNFLHDNGDGTWSLQKDGSTDGYWKSLVDYKMYDNDGNGAPQTEVRPIFDMRAAKKVMDKFDGDPNTLPIAQDVVDRFVKEYKDTKYSLKSNGESRSYQSTITKLENQVKDLKSEFKRTNLKTADQKQVRIQAGKLITRHGSNMQAQKSLIDTFNEIFRLYKENGTDAFDEVYEIAKNEAVNIVNNISVVHNEGEETYKAIKDYLRNTPITISEDMKRNITDFNDFRKRYFGKLKITNGNTTNIDTVYMELMELFPEQFTEDYVNPADQLYHMADVLDNYAPYYETLDGASEEMQDYVVDIASDIMETAYGLQTKRTFADKKYEEKVRAVEKARQKALESRDVALDRQKKRYEKKLNDLKQHNKDVREGRRERKEESELRSKLLKVARRLDKMKTTKENRTLIQNLIGDMDLVAKSMTGKTLNDLNDLRNWYDEQKEADPFFYDSNVEAKLKRLTKKQIANMDLNDVRDLNEVLRAIETSIRTADKFLKSYYNKSVKKAGLEVIEDVNNSKGVKDNPLGTIDRFFINGTLSPERQIHRITGYNDNDPLYVATKELSKGQRDMLFYQMNSWNMFKKFMKDKQFINSLNGKRAREIELSAISKGKETTIKVTPDVAISLYLSSMNDDNMRHMGVGGVEIPDIKAYKNGELKKAYRNSTRVTFSKEQLAAIEGSLTKQEKAFADTAHEYYNSVAPKAINEVSEILKGYSLAQVENYFPIQVNKNFLDRDFESLKFDGTIEGMGSLKERVKASNPIVINGIVDTITRSINENSMYVGLAIPVRNYSKLLGVKNITYTESDRGGKTETKVEYNGSVNESISKKWGDQAMKYIEKFMTDLQTSRGSDDDWEAVLNKWRSNYAGAVLTLNASVAIKQAASYPTAMAVLGAKPLARAMADVGKVDLDLIEKYTPLQWYRSQGYSTKELGDIRAGRKGSAVDKLTSVPILNWIQAMDVLTTRKLWKASEYYVRQNNRSLKQGSDEYYKAVADIYNRVIEETQPNYTVMQRPGLLRSDKSMVQMLNMFKTQPYQNFNILYDSIGNYKAKAKVYKKDKSTKAQTDVKKAYKDMQNAVLSQVLQLAVFAAMTSLWALFRGKDDKWRDEEGNLSIESYMKQLGKDMLSGSAAMIPLGADLYNAISSAITGDYYYGFSSVTDSSISDLFNSLNQTMTLIPSVAEYAKERRPGEPIPDELKKSSKKLLENTSRFSGIPYSNLRNLWDGVYRWAAIAGHGEYVGEYLSQKATFAKNSVMMDNLFKAYRNDKAQYDELRQMMIDDGIKESSIDYAMKDRMKKNKTEAEQREYDDSISTLERSSLWKDADAEDKEDYEKIIEKIAVGIEDGDTESYAKLASSGVSEEQAILYKLALKKVDKPNKNGNLGTYTNDEKEAALRLLMKDFNLTAKQKEALKG